MKRKAFAEVRVSYDNGIERAGTGNEEDCAGWKISNAEEMQKIFNEEDLRKNSVEMQSEMQR